jgi:hypothetical protein
MRKTISYIAVLCVFGLIAAASSRADTITFATPSGSSTSGGAVDASATFVTGDGTIGITLTDLQANPTDVAQLISDLDFTLSNGATSGTLASSSGQQITVQSGGTYTLGNTGSTGWGLNDNVNGGLQLDALGYVGPKSLIIGPPGSGGVYSNANGSIAGNAGHNPFLNQSATFLLAVTGVTVNTAIDSAVFSFGTTSGINVDGDPNTPVVPEPPSLLLLGTGLLVLAGAFKTKLLLA